LLVVFGVCCLSPLDELTNNFKDFQKTISFFFWFGFALKYLALMMEVWLQKENAYKMQKREHHLFVVGVYCGRKKEFQQDSSVFEKQIGGL